MRIGRVAELWRYPVKSMRGERVVRADVQAGYGLPGDRGWAVREEAAGEIRSAKKIPTLLQFATRYVDEPAGAGTPTVEITLPDGTTVRSDAPDVHAQLSKALGRDVTLWPRVPPENTAHYERRDTIGVDEMRRQYGLDPDEPLPDMSSRDPERSAQLRQYVSPLGTYFDAYELHLLSSTALDRLRTRFPHAGVDVRRYRPNVLIDTGAATDDHPEFAWVGRRVRIGALTIDVARPMQRCSMIVHEQADLARDRTVLRALVRETGHCLGVAAVVVEPGPIAVGDAVELL